MSYGASGKPRAGGAYQRTKGWKEVDVLAYIQNKTGEYDEIEREILSDPWADGYELCMTGRSISAIREIAKSTPLKSWRRKTRCEYVKLMRRGFRDCEREMKCQ